MLTPLADLNYAMNYMSNIFESDDWDLTDNNKRIKALAEATLIINNLQYRGTKTDPNQENEFPRLIDGLDIGVPEDIKKACVEIAFSLTKGFDSEMDIRETMTESRQIGGRDTGINSSFYRKSDLAHVRHGVMSHRAWGYLEPYLENYRNIKFERVN